MLAMKTCRSNREIISNNQVRRLIQISIILLIFNNALDISLADIGVIYQYIVMVVGVIVIWYIYSQIYREKQNR